MKLKLGLIPVCWAVYVVSLATSIVFSFGHSPTDKLMVGISSFCIGVDMIVLVVFGLRNLSKSRKKSMAKMAALDSRLQQIQQQAYSQWHTFNPSASHSISTANTSISEEAEVNELNKQAKARMQ